ncbi:predicted protein, partial [Nematostella vectensis]
KDLTHEASIIIANVDDEESLNRMCSRTKIVLNCVGPYRFYGEPVVKAAVENGCHHLDVSGEPEFLETMQLKYNDLAKQKGVHVIGACGFDSIPADMGVAFATEQFPGNLCHLETYMSMHSGPKGFVGHYGTYHSIIYGVASNFEGNLKKYPKVFSLGLFSHEGPTKEQMEQASFSLLMYGSGYGKKTADLE